MSKILQLPRCPYCHKKISYISSTFMKTKGEHNCASCKCISNVVISKTAYALARLVCIAAFLIVLLYSISGDHGSFLGIAAVLAPFLVFYLIVPFFVRLEPCKDQSAVRKILDRDTANRPNDSAYQAAANSAAKPVKLDVEDDFSKKFMQAKHRNTRTLQENTENAAEVSPDEIEDIGNTRLSFEISHEGWEAVPRYPARQEETPQETEDDSDMKEYISDKAPLEEEEPVQEDQSVQEFGE